MESVGSDLPAPTFLQKFPKILRKWREIAKSCGNFWENLAGGILSIYCGYLGIISKKCAICTISVDTFLLAPPSIPSFSLRFLLIPMISHGTLLLPDEAGQQYGALKDPDQNKSRFHTGFRIHPIKRSGARASRHPPQVARAAGLTRKRDEGGGSDSGSSPIRRFHFGAGI